MKPAGPLMIEHRLIERMVALLARTLEAMKTSAEVNTGLILIGVDFFRVYADRTHHGKKENILFAELRDKPMSDDEQARLDRFWEFDRTMIHEKYRNVVEEQEPKHE